MKLEKILSQYVDEFNSIITQYLANLDSCIHTGTRYSVLQTQPVLIYQGLSSVFSEDSPTSSLNMSSFVKELTDKFSSELDCLLCGTNEFMHMDNENGKSWTSIILSDLEYSIRMACLECTVSVSKLPSQIRYSSVRLGSVYAWARELNSFNPGIPFDVMKCRERLCHRLTRLVWLSKFCKQRTSTHLLITSLRHELVKIRTRFTGRFSIDKAVSTVPTKLGRLHPIRISDHPLSFNRPVIAPKLANTFAKLADEITDLLLKLSPQIQGLSVINMLADPQERKSYLRDQVELAILDFYSHLDETPENQSNHRSISIDEILNGRGSSPTESSSSDEFSKPELSINPAVVQALLDKFDHYNWNRHKRSTTNRPRDTTGGWFDPPPVLTNATSTTAGSVVNAKMQSVNQSSNAIKLNEPILDGNKHNGEIDEEIDLDGFEAACNNFTTMTRSTPKPVIVSKTTTTQAIDKPNAQSNSDRTTKRTHSQMSRKYRPHTQRSIRTRNNGTPSDTSYSEGEVLSDTEDETEEDGLRDDDDDDDHLHVLAKRPMSNPSSNQQTLPNRTTETSLCMDSKQPLATTPFNDQTKFDNDVPFISVLGQSETVNQNTTDTSCPLNEIDTNYYDIGDKQVQKLLDEYIEFCQSIMQAIILQTQADLHNPENVAKINSFDENFGNLAMKTDECLLSNDLEASINRTTSAFKEHVTSVLANLLHAVTITFEKNKIQNNTTPIFTPVVTVSNEDDLEPPVINIPCRRSTRRRFTDRPVSGMF